MSKPPIWEVNLYVYGPITVQHQLRLNEPKGFRLQDPFYSDIEIRRANSGVEATITAYASTEQLAYKAALLFFGQMLDTLALQIDQPLYLSLYGRRNNFGEPYNTRRRIETEEWKSAFREARLLALTETTFLRALGWYRKGLYTEDPFDKFLAFWNSIEIVTGKYHPPIPEDKPKGSKSQMWESFKELWGNCEKWPVIGGETTWIDSNSETRIEIAHGTKPIEVESIEAVLSKIDTIRQVAHIFLTGWREKKLNPQVLPELEEKFGY